jgi:hypothetical protein
MHQEYASQKTWQSDAFPSHVLRRHTTHFSGRTAFVCRCCPRPWPMRDASVRRKTRNHFNFCVPHASVRQPLPQPEPTHGSGSATQWRPCTPAMAVGLTDPVWTLREVLLFRVPPWPQRWVATRRVTLRYVSSSPPFRTGLATFTASGSALSDQSLS